MSFSDADILKFLPIQCF